MKDIKTKPSPQKNRSLTRGSYFLLWGTLFLILMIIGFYQGRTHKRQWKDQEYVIYFYSDNEFINQDAFIPFENTEGVKVVLKKFQNLEELNLEIITYHQDAVMLISEDWLQDLAKKNLLNTLSIQWKNSLHQIFQIEKNTQYLPYLWTHNLETTPSTKKNISIWGIGTPSNSDSTDNTLNLINFLLTKTVILNILEKNPDLVSTSKEIEDDPKIPFAKKPSSLINLKLIRDPNN